MKNSMQTSGLAALYCGSVLKKHYSTRHFRRFITIILLFWLLGGMALCGHAQAPTTSYIGPQTYIGEIAVTPLVPARNGVAVPGYSSRPVILGSGFNCASGAEEGDNTINPVVIASDSKTIDTYAATVRCASTSNANLADLTHSSGTRSPSFAIATTSYTAWVTNTTTSFTITPTRSDITATITVNNPAVMSVQLRQISTYTIYRAKRILQG
jgi:hypothetical protein